MQCNVIKKIIWKIQKYIVVHSQNIKQKKMQSKLRKSFGLQLIRSFKNIQINCPNQIRTESICNSLAKKRLYQCGIYVVRYIYTIFFKNMQFYYYQKLLVVIYIFLRLPIHTYTRILIFNEMNVVVFLLLKKSIFLVYELATISIIIIMCNIY